MLTTNKQRSTCCISRSNSISSRRNDIQARRHQSVDTNLTRNKTEPYKPRAPETPPEASRSASLSQADEYRPGHNPREARFNPFSTPQGAAPCNTSGQHGNDWGVTESSHDFELEMFEKLFRQDMEGPCAATTSSMTRGIFASVTSAFGQKAAAVAASTLK
jgi:hypothetical protein